MATRPIFSLFLLRLFFYIAVLLIKVQKLRDDSGFKESMQFQRIAKQRISQVSRSSVCRKSSKTNLLFLEEYLKLTLCSGQTVPRSVQFGADICPDIRVDTGIQKWSQGEDIRMDVRTISPFISNSYGHPHEYTC